MALTLTGPKLGGGLRITNQNNLAKVAHAAFLSRLCLGCLGLGLHGCPLCYQGAPCLGKLCDRFIISSQRLVAADLGVKVKVIAASVYPAAFHGAELFPLGEPYTRSLCHHVAEALVGPSESMSAVLVSLCASKHVHDPELHLFLKACAAAEGFYRLMTGDRATQVTFFRYAAEHFPRPNTSKGPASTLKFVHWFLGLHSGVCLYQTTVSCLSMVHLGVVCRALLAGSPAGGRVTSQVPDWFLILTSISLVRLCHMYHQENVDSWDVKSLVPFSPQASRPSGTRQADTKFHRFFARTATQQICEPFVIVFNLHFKSMRLTRPWWHAHRRAFRLINHYMSTPMVAANIPLRPP